MEEVLEYINIYVSLQYVIKVAFYITEEKFQEISGQQDSYIMWGP